MRLRIYTGLISVICLCFAVSVQAYSGEKARNAWGVTKAVKPQQIVDVYPLAINLSSKRSFEPYRDYLRPLLNIFSRQSIYQLDNGELLKRRYRFARQERSQDKNKTVLSFKQAGGSRWGYITTSVGSTGVVNAFAIKHATGQLNYALVIKRMRICLVSNASSAPKWHEDQWRFAQAPGVFECTGAAKQNIFNLRSGFPAVLGPYYEEKDTVLVFDQPSELKRVVHALKHQFPQLTIPVIPQS